MTGGVGYWRETKGKGDEQTSPATFVWINEALLGLGHVNKSSSKAAVISKVAESANMVSFALPESSQLSHVKRSLAFTKSVIKARSVKIATPLPLVVPLYVTCILPASGASCPTGATLTC